VAACGTFKFLLKPIVNATGVENVAAVEHFDLHAWLERVQANAAQNGVIIDLLLLHIIFTLLFLASRLLTNRDGLLGKRALLKFD
jgi:hypothetical protein